MNQLTNDEQDVLLTDSEKEQFLYTFLSEEQFESYLKDFNERKFYFHFFNPFCRAYAKYLLSNGSLTYYGSFIEEFNRLMKKDKNYKHYKESQNLLNEINGAFSFFGFNYNDLLIEDERYKISGKEFKYESDLEHLISSELENYFGEEITISTQEFHGYGRADITINGSIALELKKGKAKRKDVYQTFEYSFDEKIKETCLIASDFDDDVIKIANKLSVNCFAYCFMYEDPEMPFEDQYPIGFILEKVNKTNSDFFDEFIPEMDAFWISYYDPKFKFSKVYDAEYNTNLKVHDRSVQIINEHEKCMLNQWKDRGYDISNGIQGVIDQIKEKNKGVI